MQVGYTFTRTRFDLAVRVHSGSPAWCIPANNLAMYISRTSTTTGDHLAVNIDFGATPGRRAYHLAVRIGGAPATVAIDSRNTSGSTDHLPMRIAGASARIGGAHQKWSCYNQCNDDKYFHLNHSTNLLPIAPERHYE